MLFWESSAYEICTVSAKLQISCFRSSSRASDFPVVKTFICKTACWKSWFWFFGLLLLVCGLVITLLAPREFRWDRAPAHSVKQTGNNYHIDTASLEQLKQGIYLSWELKEAITTFPLVFLFCLLMRPGSCPSDLHQVHIWRTLHSLAYLCSGKF